MQRKYNMVKERISNDVYTITYTAKERKCDICVSVKKSKDITVVKYPIIDKCMGRLIMTKRVCNECYGDVMEILNNLKYD